MPAFKPAETWYNKAARSHSFSMCVGNFLATVRWNELHEKVFQIFTFYKLCLMLWLPKWVRDGCKLPSPSLWTCPCFMVPELNQCWWSSSYLGRDEGKVHGVESKLMQLLVLGRSQTKIPGGCVRPDADFHTWAKSNQMSWWWSRT